MPMEGKSLPLALILATAWGQIAEESWCRRNFPRLMDDDDARASKRLKMALASLDRLTEATRNDVTRSTGGWVGSTLYGYVYCNEGNESLHRM